MILTFNNGYPDYIGYRQAFVGHGTGPASYLAAGDPVTLQNSRRFIDILFGGMVTLSGTYIVNAFPSATGERITWKAIWIVAATGAPVAPGTVLSGETVTMGGFCGQY